MERAMSAARKKRRKRKWITAAVILAALAALSSMGYNRVMRMLYPVRYEALVTRYAAEYGLDPLLVYAVIHTESGFDPSAKSNAGAQGLMQLTPETAEWARMKLGELGTQADIYDPATNIRYGVYVFSSHLNEFGSIELASAAYHAGRGSVNRWLNNEEYSGDGVSLQKIPYGDTGKYVKKIDRTYTIYKNLYQPG